MPGLFTLRSCLGSPDATAAAAARIASRLAPGDTLLLTGDLGAGKSHFARALIRARLGDPRAEVPSPSFTLVQTYEAGPVEIWHADLYRLSGPDEVMEIGLADAFDAAICLVEWPDRLGAETPVGAARLTLDITGEDTRLLTVTAPLRWRPIFADLPELLDA